MAAEAQSTTTADTSQQSASNLDPWNPSRIEEALAHLESLQSQLDALRSAIPSLVKPLKSSSSNDPNRTKAAVFMGVRKATAQRNEELRLLREAWEREETREVFERCRESERVDGDLGRAAEVGVWGWSEVVQGKEGKE